MSFFPAGETRDAKDRTQEPGILGHQLEQRVSREKSTLCSGNPGYCLGSVHGPWRAACQFLTESGVGSLCFKLSACLPDCIWIEWLAFAKPHLIGLKEKKCYFSSHKTTKRNGKTKILFRLNKLQGDSLGHFLRER